GEGPFFTPRTSRRAKAGQSEGVVPKSSVTLTGHGKRRAAAGAAFFSFVVCLLLEPAVDFFSCFLFFSLSDSPFFLCRCFAIEGSLFSACRRQQRRGRARCHVRWRSRRGWASG